MDQGNTALWVAGLGISGTLLGTMGGAAVQGWVSRRQIRDQEAADTRRWLREQRQAAYITVLECGDRIEEVMRAILGARIFENGADDNADIGEHEQALRQANRDFGKAVIRVAAAGPGYIADLAEDFRMAASTMSEDMWGGVRRDDWLERLEIAITELEDARYEFVVGIQAELSGRAGLFSGSSLTRRHRQHRRPQDQGPAS